MHFGVAFWPGLAVSLAAALAYGLYFERRPESLLRAAVKTLFMGALVVAFWGGPPPLIVALIAAALGDFFLAFEKKWTLPLGMIAFLLMQFCYISGFIGLWMLSGDGAPLLPRYVLMGGTALLVLGFLVWLWRDVARPISAAGAILGCFVIGAWLLVLPIAGNPAVFDPNNFDPHVNWIAIAAVFIIAAVLIFLRRDLGAVKLGGMVYASVLTQMAMLSFWQPWTAWPAMLGAILFIVSDGVLSTELFRIDRADPIRRLTGPLVWWTYAAAQLLIIWGMMRAVGVMV